MYKRILVPIDGSDTAARGLAEAISLARELKATLRLLNLTSDFVLMVEMSNVIDEKFREAPNQFWMPAIARAGERNRPRAQVTAGLRCTTCMLRVPLMRSRSFRQSRCDSIITWPGTWAARRRPSDARQRCRERRP